MKKFSVKQALLDLLYVDIHLPKVAKDYPDLKDLIQFIVNHKALEDDDVAYPSIKEAADATKIDYHKIRDQILILYSLMFPFKDSPYLKFDKVKYQLNFSFYKNSHHMVIDRFPVPLRVGENLTIPFLQAKLGTDRFYVAKIRHHFERDIQKIIVTLYGGDYNLFWHHRKDEALEKEEIDIMSIYDKDDYTLKQELIRGGY